jgi:predicted nucleic acid-binding protein
VSNPRVFTKPIPISVAWEHVKTWLEQPPAWAPAPTDCHQETLEKMIQAISTSNHVPDAELASLAIQHGLELMTADRGFARFPGLRFRNPLE